MPVASMRRYGWLSKNQEEMLSPDELLRFFGCSNLKDWGIRYSNGLAQ